MNCQIVHDSIHRREGWTLSYLLGLGDITAGFGSVAIGGPWKDKPTVFEFYLLPEHRSRAFDFFEAFLATSSARSFEVQTNDLLLTVMLHTYGRDIASEKIVFHDKLITALPSNGAIFRWVTSEEETRLCLEQRQGGGEWLLEMDDKVAARGGILFHYNRPYGDILHGSGRAVSKAWPWLLPVQELKRRCYELGAVRARVAIRPTSHLVGRSRGPGLFLRTHSQRFNWSGLSSRQPFRREPGTIRMQSLAGPAIRRNDLVCETNLPVEKYHAAHMVPGRGADVCEMICVSIRRVEKDQATVEIVVLWATTSLRAVLK